MRWFCSERGVRIGSLVIPRDCHTHLLPGVDDGRFTPRSAAATLEKMRAAGTRRVGLTPHIMAGAWEGAGQRFGKAMDEMLANVRGPIPELGTGAEYMIDEALLQHVRSKGGADTLRAMEPGRVLVEMSWWDASPQLFDVVEVLTGAGIVPVLAHPERYPYLAERMDTLDRLHASGCEFQLNLLSTTGIYGGESTLIMNYLLERSWYSHVGSDVHSPGQYDRILNSRMDGNTASAGERASLWSTRGPGENISKDQTPKP
jgi:tyrosine-protein phosphatase YwqE